MAELAAKKVAIVGAGWAGCAAAVEATRRGHQVTLFEASHHAGGRARRLESAMRTNAVDNGQHILIGAYTETLALMRSIGVDVDAAFVRTPLQLQDPQGRGLQLSAAKLPPALAVALAVLSNREWRWGERLALMATALRWQMAGFACPEDWTVQRLCQGLPERVMHSMIEPLCVSALNTPTHRASASVFLRVLHDAMFAVQGGSDLLIPRTDLSALLPEPALAWLTAQGADVRLGTRVTQIAQAGAGWQIQTGQPGSATADQRVFDALILALPHKGAAQFLRHVLATDSFATAKLDTALIQRESAQLFKQQTIAPALAVAAVVGRVLQDERATQGVHPFSQRDGWRSHGLWQRRFDVLLGELAGVATLTYGHGGALQLTVKVGEAEAVQGDLSVRGVDADALDVSFGSERLRAQVYLHGEHASVFTVNGFAQVELIDRLAHAGEVATEGGRLTAPMPGKVVSFAVKAGDKVSKGQALAVMEAMKMEHTIAAPKDGTVAELLYAPGDQVTEGAELLKLEA